MDRYLHELYDVDIGTGNSLAAEINYQHTVVDKLTACLTEMSTTLERLAGIEYELYYEIVVKRRHITNAVEYIAEKYDKDTQTIWKYHYPKIKNEVKKLAMYSECTVNNGVQCTM
jgi:hypothetical protein